MLPVDARQLSLIISVQFMSTAVGRSYFPGN